MEKAKRLSAPAPSDNIDPLMPSFLDRMKMRYHRIRVRIRHFHVLFKVRFVDRILYEIDRVLLWRRDLRDCTHILASRGGLFGIHQQGSVKIAGGQYFGISVREDGIYCFQATDRIGEKTTRGRIIRLTLREGRIQSVKVMLKGLPNGIHQIDFRGNDLYMVNTYHRGIIRVNAGFSEWEQIHPLGKADMRTFPWDDAHINSIAARNGDWYLLKHNRTSATGKPSELVRFDAEWNVLDVQGLSGKECHNVVFREGASTLVCDSLQGNLIDPEGKRVHIDEMYLRGLSVDSEMIVIGASRMKPKTRRHMADGKIFFYDRNFRELSCVHLPTGPTEIRRLDGNDFSLMNYSTSPNR